MIKIFNGLHYEVEGDKVKCIETGGTLRAEHKKQAVRDSRRIEVCGEPFIVITAGEHVVKFKDKDGYIFATAYKLDDEWNCVDDMNSYSREGDTAIEAFVELANVLI